MDLKSFFFVRISVQYLLLSVSLAILVMILSSIQVFLRKSDPQLFLRDRIKIISFYLFIFESLIASFGGKLKIQELKRRKRIL